VKTTDISAGFLSEANASVIQQIVHCTRTIASISGGAKKNGAEKKVTKNKGLTLGQALLFLAPRT
jgi:phosphoribosylformimino-5-aminoimidazole carboxamide ribonucleotide (ProFAR) isomerase